MKSTFLFFLLINLVVLESHSARHRNLRRLNSFPKSNLKIADKNSTPMVFDLPVTYNPRVKKWISYFQKPGKKWFTKWLERSHRYVPDIQKILVKEKLPKDLVYVSMIESGFSTRAVSSASAVGPWQFIRSTGIQYGLRSSWWLDERRDVFKSTYSAAKYFRYLYNMFDSWYLAAAAYNMGENRLKRLIKKYKTRNYWDLSQKRTFAKETKDYVPKLIAAILISKAPQLYGFRNIKKHQPLDFETIQVPGGTDLLTLSDRIGVTRRYMKDLNPELLENFVPEFVATHSIRVPKGAAKVALSHAQKSVGIRISRK